MTQLLDGNVLVALVVEDHVHHDLVTDWFSSTERFATCPITQGTLVRLLLRGGMSGTDATRILERVVEHRRHDFWPDEFGYTDVDMSAIVGHRQVTDAYLAQLARSRSARLATLDRGVAELHRDVADLVRPPAPNAKQS